MGADLYRRNPSEDYRARKAELHSLSEQGMWDTDRPMMERLYDAIYGTDQEFYFRDSYNDSSLFWKMDLSWWQDIAKFVGPNGDGVCDQITDEDGDTYDDFALHPTGAKLLRDECARRGELLMANIQDEDDETKQYFDQKLRRFLRFLDGAIAAGDVIECSV